MMLRYSSKFLHRNPSSLMSLLQSHPSSSHAQTDFQEILSRSKNIAVLTGAGISAESGVPTFRGPGGYWRKYQAENLATPEAFRADPSLVWEFYHYRREVMLSKQPNPAHLALARMEKKLQEGLKKLSIITQNIDELHKRAGSTNILELHGSLFRVRCTRCETETSNYDSPICEALLGKGAPEPEVPRAGIPKKDLPTCTKCGGLLRPAVVWFGENLDAFVLNEAHDAMRQCDLCLLVGTSSVVYPAAMLAPEAAKRGVVVAEFNMEPTPVTNQFKFHFAGPCGVTLPRALGLENEA